MSRLVDLTPPSCRSRLKHRRSTRRWTLTYLGVALFLAVSVLALGLVRQSMERTVARLQRQVEFDETQERHASLLRAQIMTKRAQLARHDRLAWPVEVATIIATVGEATPENVALTSFAMQPRQDRTARSARGRTAPDANSGSLVIEIRGMAYEDLQIASFVAGLEQRSLFDSVTVDYARNGELLDRTVREFGLTCTVDLAPRYELVVSPGREATP